ncbi:MAG: O-antigen ligase family protein [Anaerolineae bacterium]
MSAHLDARIGAQPPLETGGAKFGPLTRLRARISAASRQHHIALNIALILTGFVLILGGNFLIAHYGLGLYVIGGFAAVVFGSLIVLRPPVGVYLLTVFIYLNLSNVLEVALHIPSINKPVVALVVIAVLANRVFLNHRPIVVTRLIGAIALYGIVLLVSGFLAPYKDPAINYIIDWVKDIAILIIIVQMSDDESTWKRMVWLLIICAGIEGMLSSYQVLTGNYSNQFFGLANTSINQITENYDGTRVLGMVSDPNYYGQILLMVFPMAAYRAFVERNPLLRLVAIASSGFIITTVIFTYSRGAFMALLIVSALMIIERRFKLFNVIAILTVTLFVLMPFMPAGYLERLTTLEYIFQGGDALQSEDSLKGRSSEAMVAVSMFLDHPLFGIGIANYESNYLDYSVQFGIDRRLENREAHSLYLEALAETGIIGVFVLGIVFVVAFTGLQSAKAKLRSIHREDLVPYVVGAQLGLLSYLTTSLFLHNAYSRYLWQIIAVCAGAIVLADALVLRARARERVENTTLSHEPMTVLGVPIASASQAARSAQSGGTSPALRDGSASTLIDFDL